MLRPRSACRGFGCLLVAAAFLAACTPNESPAPVGSETSATSTPGAPRPGAAREDDQPSRPVVAEVLPYGDVDEKLVYGYFAIPEDMIDPLPAIIVVHDWWGLDDHMRALAERLAGEGYIVLGVDLFGGGTASVLAEARDLEISVLENPDLAMENLTQARDFIMNTAGAPQVAVLGYGFGGGWSLRATTDLAEGFTASVSYYGQVLDDENRLARLDTPFLGLFAENDRAIPAADVRRFEEALVSLEKDAQIHLYSDARRGFADPRSENYQPETASDAWDRVVGFLSEKMTQASR